MRKIMAIVLDEKNPSMIECDEDNILDVINDTIAVNGHCIDVDLPAFSEKYRIIANCDSENNSFLNFVATHLSNTYENVYGKAVLIRVKNNFESGLECDIESINQADYEIVKILYGCE